MKVRDIMTPNPTCCLPDDNVQQPAMIMKDLNVGAVPVVDNPRDRRPVGMVTDRDLCCSVLASGIDPKTARVSNYMTPEPICCRPDDPVARVSDIMRDRQIRRLPVVDDSGACCGIVAMADLAVKAPSSEAKPGQTLEEISQPASPAQAA